MFGATRLNTLSVYSAPAGGIAITNSGSVTVDTSVKNVGSGSAKFPGGNGQYLRSADLTGVPLSGDFTIELWARMTATNAGSGYILKNYNYTGAGAFGTGCFNLYFSTSTQFIFAASGISNITGVIAIGTWYHFAIVRSGSTLTVYKNGVSAGTATYSASVFPSANKKLLIGTFNESAETLNGNIDEIRVSNTARYTSGFTPTTTAFNTDANTLFLMHGDGTNGSTTFTDDH
jgi:hypothetical protein